MAIRDWPLDERPREKLLDKGAGAQSDAELPAILLRTGTPGHSALDFAREVLKNFHSLRKLIASDRKRFCAEPGLGPTRFAELQAAVEIARRQLTETLRAGPSLSGWLCVKAGSSAVKTSFRAASTQHKYRGRKRV